ncbi:MAG: NAD(+) diphosphatase [Alphaproteobacteria bacterium]|nr:NAD(+) diphosphatase [Alphaproteobacteria bacterium]
MLPFAPMLKNLWYTGAPLDRVSHLREDAAWVAARRRAKDTRLVPVWRSRSLVHTEDDRALILTVEEAGELLDSAQHEVVLGLEGDTLYIGLDLSHLDDPYGHPRIGAEGAFEDLRQIGPVIPADEGAILAHARGMMTWHQRHLFCGVCGAPTEVSHGGYQRNCTGCSAQHFPRTDPAVIMLVHKGDNCLLGRTHHFPRRIYSTLAGFVEPGESLEEAVAREVFEEAGVTVGEVRYMASQPWPFPSSLMLGFHAEAEAMELNIDPKELEDARWMTREQIGRIEEFDMELPRRDSIAWRLVKAWMDDF